MNFPKIKKYSQHNNLGSKKRKRKNKYDYLHCFVVKSKLCQFLRFAMLQLSNITVFFFSVIKCVIKMKTKPKIKMFLELIEYHFNLCSIYV